MTAALLAISFSAKAQMENIKIDSNTVIKKLYAGMYTKGQTPTDSLDFSTPSSFRVGALINHKFSDVFSVDAEGAVQLSNGPDYTSIGAFEFIGQFTDRWQVRVGYLTTPTSLIRPNPITWQSQSETYAQSRILAQQGGIMTSYQVNDDLSLTYGFHHQFDTWAHHLKINYKHFKIGGYIQNDGEYFGVIDYSKNKWRGLIDYSSEEDELAGSLFYDINDRFTVYTDDNFRFDNRDSQITRLGARSHFHNNDWHIKGFLALEYDFSAKIASAELFIHLD